MASLEQRGSGFRVAFRLGGAKHQVVVKATNHKEAEACLGRIEDNLRLVERGRLAIPEGADVGLFLLSDSKLEQRLKTGKSITLGELVAKYRSVFTAGVKEKNTAKTEAIHLGHAERVLGSKTPITQISSATLQGYIDARVATEYKRRAINSPTIKKEVATLKYVWNWAFRNDHVGAGFPGIELVYPKTKLKEPFRTLDQIASIVDRGGLTKIQVRELWDALYLNPSEIAEVLEHIRQRAIYPWLFPFIATAAHTGARRSELLRGRVDDFDFGNRVVILREKKRSKDRETFRSVELTPFLERVMREYFDKRHVGGMTVSLLTLASPHSCPKLQSLSVRGPSVPACNANRPSMVSSGISARGATRASADSSFYRRQWASRASSDGNRSSGARRNSSALARV